MTNRLYYRLLLIPIWFAGLWVSLQVHTFDLNLGHGICGPWGCGPPLEALIGYHGFWLMIALPVACGLGWCLPRPVSRQLGLAMALAGCLLALAIVGLDLFNFARTADSRSLLIQRGLFTLVTKVDLPSLQIILAGMVLAFVFGRPSMQMTAKAA